ncbi:MAG: ribbon-helix-helix domain-containing protein [Pararhodobacter sp.]|nr:ribbon-helix-helix domain-containing protein [Pararhodobacter sp.]
MSGRPEKHSLTLRGHRTSVSLEAEFWDAFRALAREQGQGINQLATEIDEARGNQGLASAIRVAVLRALQAQAAGHAVRPGAVPPDPRDI